MAPVYVKPGDRVRVRIKSTEAAKHHKIHGLLLDVCVRGAEDDPYPVVHLPDGRELSGLTMIEAAFYLDADGAWFYDSETAEPRVVLIAAGSDVYAFMEDDDCWQIQYTVCIGANLDAEVHSVRRQRWPEVRDELCSSDSGVEVHDFTQKVERHSRYGWIIDVDHLEDDETQESDAGVMGPSRISPEIVARLKAGEGKLFRLLDGDGNPDYEGRIILPDDEAQGELLFAPLDEFGKGNAGSAEIQYLEDGRWIPL